MRDYYSQTIVATPCIHVESSHSCLLPRLEFAISAKSACLCNRASPLISTHKAWLDRSGRQYGTTTDAAILSAGMLIPNRTSFQMCWFSRVLPPLVMHTFADNQAAATKTYMRPILTCRNHYLGQVCGLQTWTLMSPTCPASIIPQQEDAGVGKARLEY